MPMPHPRTFLTPLNVRITPSMMQDIHDLDADRIEKNILQLKQTPEGEDSRLGELKRYMLREKRRREEYLQRCRRKKNE